MGATLSLAGQASNPGSKFNPLPIAAGSALGALSGYALNNHEVNRMYPRDASEYNPALGNQHGKYKLNKTAAFSLPIIIKRHV